ncbi:hypothetical protein GGF46_001547 [Coemansia sp. RSA 552]|nr:hypothetical protein GGF46_001547 [Coemansia sp. RSA 552]
MTASADIDHFPGACTLGTPTDTSAYRFVDCRTESLSDSPQDALPTICQIVRGLATQRALPGTSAPATRSLPTVLLYDDAGLDYFDRITYIPQYYLTGCEIEILRTRIHEIVAEIPDGSDVIELGCGSLRKTELLLDALNRQRVGITYHAIDVMPRPLHQAMAKLAAQFTNVTFIALCGTYDQVLPRLGSSTHPKTVLWLGSSIGNYHANDAVRFLAQVSQSVLAADDAIIVGMDLQKEATLIKEAYHDSQGLTAGFELNILAHINRLVADFVRQKQGTAAVADTRPGDLFDLQKFFYCGDYDASIGRHNSFLEAKEDFTVRWPSEVAAYARELGAGDSLVIQRGERIYIESSYKYSDSAAEVLGQTAGLVLSAQWVDSRNYYALCSLRKPRATMLAPLEHSPVSLDKWCMPASRYVECPLPPFSTIPTIDEWQSLWKVWDLITLHVIPRAKLQTRPIGLRHPFIFYLGHIPAFADIHMAAAEAGPLSHPVAFAQWFERGIDPNMEDPTICHSHSKVPDVWPPTDEILAYRDRVRDRITAWMAEYERSGHEVSAEAARRVWMAFEHEALHIETLLYMVLQMDPADICSPIQTRFPQRICPRPGTQWIDYKGSPDVCLGLVGDNEEALTGTQLPPGHIFGWDSESPATNVSVKPFRVRTQPITNGEYLDFLQAFHASEHESNNGYSLADLVPQSWVLLDECPGTASATDTIAWGSRYGVRTAVGTPLIVSTGASLWPVLVSQIQADAYARRLGKRLPLESEWTYAARTYHLAQAVSKQPQGPAYSPTEALDAYLEKRLAMQGDAASRRTCYPYDVFVPGDANIGFAHWHPAPIPASARLVPGDGGLPDATFIGSAWEWTSTQFRPYDGFRPSPAYPGYSADFFDPPSDYDKESTHFVIKGGSYATHPRIAGRQTARNWYQRGYPYVLATFRLCENRADP